VKFHLLIAALVIAISVSNLTFGGSKDSTQKANTFKTVVAGINSQNFGLSQSSIYLSGFYKFPWAVDPLIDVLNNSVKDTFTRVLAAYSLYMIGDEKGMHAIKTVSTDDSNYILNETCKFIYDKYLNIKSESVTLAE
jgi:hypothetical protein